MLTRLLQPLLLISIIVMPFTLFAQQVFKEGYIITAADTIHGYLKEDIESSLTNGVTFYKNASGTPSQFYGVDNIKAFHFNGGNIFQLVRFTDANGIQQQYFAKLLLKGYYDLFSFRKDERQYFVVTTKDSSILLYDDTFLVDGQPDQKGNFKNILRFLAVDCNSSIDRLTGLAYNEKSLIDFITGINHCNEPSGNSTTYYVKAKSKVTLYAFAGALPMGKQSQYAGRIIARFSLPSISKNTSINTGISYLSRNTIEEYHFVGGYNSIKKKHTVNILSAGLTMQNSFTSGVIRPYLEAGLGFAYKKEKIPVVNPRDARQKYGVDIIVATGVEGFITPRLVVKADWRYELIVNYPVVGVAYFFK